MHTISIKTLKNVNIYAKVSGSCLKIDDPIPVTICTVVFIVRVYLTTHGVLFFG